MLAVRRQLRCRRRIQRPIGRGFRTSPVPQTQRLDLFRGMAQLSRSVRVTLRLMFSGEQSAIVQESQASVFQRQWPCTLASLLIVVPFEMFAGACRAIRCAEASVRRSFSRKVIVVTVLGACRLFLSKAPPNTALERTPKASTALACATAAPAFGAAQLGC